MAKIVAIINAKGGVGKTTTAVELAYQFGTVRNLKLLCIDMDPQGNLTEMLTGQVFSEGLYDLMLAESWSKKPSEILKSALNVWNNVVVLPSDRRLGVIEPHLATKIGKENILKDLLRPVSEAFDIILIDLPPTINILTLNALACADAYLIPTDISEYSKAGINAIQKLANTVKSKGLNPNLEFCGVVITSFQKGGAIAIRALVDELIEQYADKLLPMRINDSVKVTESQRQHVPVGAAFPDNPVAVAYKELSEVIL